MFIVLCWHVGYD